MFIDTPLEVALARWVRRRLSEGVQPDEIAAHFDLYESVLRPVCRQVLPDADLVVDGLGQPEGWVARVLSADDKHPGAITPMSRG